MQTAQILDMDSPVERFCVSFVAGKVCSAGLDRHVQAWNHQTIPGNNYNSNRSVTFGLIHYHFTVMSGFNQGIPIELAQKNCMPFHMDSSFLPTAEHGVHLYELNGGRLKTFSEFGIDPLAHYPGLISQRSYEMSRTVPAPSEIFSYTVNHNYQPIANAITKMITFTEQLSNL